MENITVAVTGLNAIDSPGPGIPVIRCLKESDYFNVRIIGLSYENLEPGIYMKNLVDKAYSIPYPSAGTDKLIERLLYIHKKENINVIIPNFDAELFSFIKIKNFLKELNIATFLPNLEQFEERHKYNLYEFSKKYNINIPYTKIINTPNDIPNETNNEFKYPIVIKGKYYDAKIAKNKNQAYSYFNEIAAKWGLPIILQEFLSGTELNVAGLADGKGHRIAAVAMRKQYVTDKGKAWAGITIEDENLLSLTDKFINSTKWQGPFELEIIKTKENKYYLIEINPRIPAWIYLTKAAGQNIPEALVKLSLEKNIKKFENYTVGKMFIRYSYDMIIDLSDFEKISTLGEL